MALLLGKSLSFGMRAEARMPLAARAKEREALVALNSHALHSLRLFFEGGERIQSTSQVKEIAVKGKPSMRALNKAHIHIFLDTQRDTNIETVALRSD